MRSTRGISKECYRNIKFSFNNERKRKTLNFGKKVFAKKKDHVELLYLMKKGHVYEEQMQVTYSFVSPIF